MSSSTHFLRVNGKIKIHGFQVGSVAVHPSHRCFKGMPALRFPTILMERQWTEPLPIWVWLIETEAGRFLVDTGENADVNDGDYIGDAADAFVTRRILRLSISESEQLNNRLAGVGLTPDDIDAVILTHLHLDHTDGLRFFPDAEVLVGSTEWQNPFGAVKSTFPKWLNPKLIDYAKSDEPFSGAYPLTECVSIVPTPGHTHGHQSVLIDAGEYSVLLAGDVSFTDQQLLRNEKAGIIADWGRAGETYRRVRQYAARKPLVYLPSHDPASGARLTNRQPLI